MLKKQERLSRQEFSAHFATGRRSHTDLFSLIYTPGPTLKASAVVSKKVAKKAHERNTLRRRIYATLEHLRKDEGFSGTLIVVAKPALASLPRLLQRERLITALSVLKK